MDILGEAIQQGIAPAIVVAIYLVITKIIDTYKENNQNKITNDLVNSINNISVFLTDITKDIVDKDKDKCKNSINSAFNSLSLCLLKYVNNTIINNHVEQNKEAILKNIDNIVNTEYYSIYSILSLYKINGIRCSEYLNKEWIDELKELIISTIYKSKLDTNDKIISFSNQLHLKIQIYIVLITNKINR